MLSLLLVLFMIVLIATIVVSVREMESHQKHKHMYHHMFCPWAFVGWLVAQLPCWLVLLEINMIPRYPVEMVAVIHPGVKSSREPLKKIG